MSLLYSCAPKEKKIRTQNNRAIVDKNSIYATEYLIKPIDLKNSFQKKEIDKILYKNQVSTHLILGDLCFVFQGTNDFKAWGLKEINISRPSAHEYKKGIYYDAMIPLDQRNCENFDYGVLEITKSFSNKWLSINIKLRNESYKNLMPMFIPLEPYPYNMGMNRNIYINGDEALSKEAMKSLNNFQVQPIKNWLEPYKPDRDENFTNFVKKYQISDYINLPMLGELNQLNTENFTPWFYVFDEPTESYIPSLKKDLNRLKKKYPKIKTMVTTYFRAHLNIDIYCEVAEHLTQKEIDILTRNNKEIWMYISCMSHGCGPGRIFQDNPGQQIPSPYEFRSGAPDISIETSAMDTFALYAMTIKYPIKALLYYNSIEQWNLSQFRINPFNDMYNFGGNGDGTLIYPDFKNKSHYPSLRLALMREANYFHFALTNSAQKENIINKIKSTTDWNLDYQDILDFYRINNR